jgi:TolB-like protein/Tfp pilus assembly protein PilF
MVHTTTVSTEGASASSSSEKEKKKKKKVRNAWISFVGRVVAQVVGAVATIVLGVYFINRTSPPSREAESRPEPAVPARVVRPAGDRASIAVLPLQNLSGDPTQEYFADGMTEALIASLAQVKGLRVISRTSSMHYKQHSKTLPEIAQELGVALIVEGSVARAGDRVRVTAQLIDASRDEHLWARSYERTSRDVLGLQEEVATAIAREVTGAAQSRQRTTQAASVDPEVYDLYLRGRHAWNQRTAAGYTDAIRYFDAAIARDPKFALAHAGRADAYHLAGRALDVDAAAKARAAAARALELDDTLAEPHASLGGLLHRIDVDIDAAQREFRKAIDLNPGYATAHQWYAILLAEEGQSDEAVREAQQAVSLDPLSGPIQQTFGLVLYYARQFDRAENAARRALELSSQLTLARDILGRSLVALRRYDEAVRLLDGPLEQLNTDNLSTLGIACYLSGKRERSKAAWQVLAGRPAAVGPKVRWYVATGDNAAALGLLERASADGFNPQMIKADPALDPIRGDRRFERIVRPKAAPGT